MTGSRLVVPVSESVTLRNTVAYAVREATDRAEPGESPAVHFVYPVSQRVAPGTDAEEVSSARDLLARVAVWAEEDLGDDADSVTVETHVIGSEEYVFGPGDYAEILARHAREHDLELAVFDPAYNPVGTTPLLPPLTTEVERTGLAVEEAPVERERRGTRLVGRATLGQFLAVFGSSFVFYLALSGTVTDTFELATGAISATVVTVVLGRVSVTRPVRPGRALGLLGRVVLYVPYLLWEIAKSNLHIAYIVLHPKLPIDPEVVEFDAAVWTPLSTTTLANSITLTPGTLTVDVSRRQFTVHALTGNSREGLLDGGLERAVRFVFFGRSAARIASPRERRRAADGHESTGESDGPNGGGES
jgi:multicomponent Na+:H+ antiporter subunit E